jgi:hypothetical protein
VGGSDLHAASTEFHVHKDVVGDDWDVTVREEGVDKGLAVVFLNGKRGWEQQDNNKD